MIVRPYHMNCLTVVMNEDSSFAFVKLAIGTGFNYFGEAPAHLLDDWRWKCERERGIAEARSWVHDYPDRGLVVLEGEIYSFGPDERYRKKRNLPNSVCLAYEWLWTEVMDHDVNLRMKKQEVVDGD